MASIVGSLGSGSNYEWKKDNLKVAELLVAKGADLNAQDEEGWTPLHTTTRRNYLPGSQFLVENGASVAIKNQSGLTPLEQANKTHARDVAKYLKGLLKSK
jgi:protein phosphatase 1 regulatory subunit 12A